MTIKTRPAALMSPATLRGRLPSSSCSHRFAWPGSVYRNSSSKAASTFFTPSSSSSSSSEISPVKAFRQALQSRKRHDIRDAFSKIITRADHSPSEWPRLESSDILQAIQVLGSSPAKEASGLLYHICKEATRTLGLVIEPELYRAAILALAPKHVPLALALAKELDKGVISDREWAAILGAAFERRTDLVDEVLRAIQEAGQMTDIVAAERIANLHRNFIGQTDDKKGDGGSLDELLVREATLLEMMKKDGVELGIASEIELARIRILTGDLEEARQLSQRRDRSNLSDYLQAKALTLDAELAVANDDMDSFKRSARSLIQLGAATPNVALERLVAKRLKTKSAKTEGDILDAIAQVETLTGEQASPETWASTIHAFRSINSTPKSVDSILLAYGDFLARGIPVASVLAMEIIDALIQQRPPRINDAMDVYRDLSAARKSHSGHHRYFLNSHDFGKLFKASAEASPPAFNHIVFLCEEVHRLGVKMPIDFLTSFAIQLIRISPNHDIAFNLYDNLRNLGNESLAERQYNVIIAEFISLASDTSPVPPPDLVIEIIKDMRRIGYRPGPHILTALLCRYSQIAKQTRKSSKDTSYRESLIASLLSAVRSIHTLLRLDSYLETDVPLLVALMSAYSALESWREAFEVWQELVERRPRESQDLREQQKLYGPAISVILDTCGYSGSITRARKAWTWARRNHLDNRHNWDTWIECLSRLGELDEAMRVVVEEMGKEGNPAPTKNTVSILLKFSWRSPKEMQRVSDMVKTRFPEWWSSLKEIVDSKKSVRRSLALA